MSKYDIAPYVINPSMAEFVTIRKARKTYGCFGGHDGNRNIPCRRPIPAGSLYVECTSESTPFHSGHRYHLECAAEQGCLIDNQYCSACHHPAHGDDLCDQDLDEPRGGMFTCGCTGGRQ